MAQFSISSILATSKAAIGRFPVATIWAVLGSLYIILLIELVSGDITDTNFDAFLTLVLGVSWFIGTQFFVEQQKNTKLWKGLNVLIFIALLLFYLYLPHSYHYNSNPSYLIYFFLFLVAGHLFVFVAPFITQWDKNAYWNYLKTSALSMLRSAFFSLVLYLGLVLALVAIDALFDANIQQKRYGQLFVFCLGIVNTMMYLSAFPKAIFKQTTIQFNKGLAVLVKYILMPLLLLYLVILYAYSFKIVISWELPKGWVSYLVIALSLLGFVIQVIISPVQKQLKSFIVARFYPYFYLLLSPLLALLFIAIIRRISDYGFTENRYMVLALAVWILAIVLYMLLSSKKAIRVLPLSLLGIVLATSFGPWGMLSVSMRSQINEFKKLYGTTLAQDKLVSREEFRRLENLLSYVNKRNQISELDATTGINLKGFSEKTEPVKGPTAYLNTRKLMDSLGITATDSEALDSPYLNNFYNYNDHNAQSSPLNIGGYDTFATIYIHANRMLVNGDELKVGDDLVVQMDSELQLCFLDNTTGVVLDTLDVNALFNQYSTYGNNFTDVPKQKLIATNNTATFSYKLVPSEVSFFLEKDKTISFNYFKFHLFYTKSE